MGPSCYIEYRGIRNRTIRGFYCIYIYICVGNLTIIGSDNGLSLAQHQAIIWTNARILLIGPTGTNITLILNQNLSIFIQEKALKLMSAKWRPLFLGLNVLTSLPSVCSVGPLFGNVVLNHRFHSGKITSFIVLKCLLFSESSLMTDSVLI